MAEDEPASNDETSESGTSQEGDQERTDQASESAGTPSRRGLEGEEVGSADHDSPVDGPEGGEEGEPNPPPRADALEREGDSSPGAGGTEAPSSDAVPGEDRDGSVSTVDLGPSPSSPAAVSPPNRRVEAPIGAVRQARRATAVSSESEVPRDVQKYDRFKKVDGAAYERVNDFLRERTYVTAREWAIARLCSDFRTETGIEMTKIGENLPHLVPFMTDTYSPQAVNQARSSFETKVRKSGATFLYGAMSDFFTADELDDIMYEVTEVAKFLLEVEGVDLAVDEELEGEERISSVMREVRRASDELRHEGTTCPNCGHEIGGNHE